MPLFTARICAILALAAMVGCAPQGAADSGPAGQTGTLGKPGMSQVATGLLVTQYVEPLRARVAAPIGWNPKPLDGNLAAAHQVWVSPTGKTAYGVARFTLPLPLGHEPVLWFFLQEMRAREGVAIVLSKTWDPEVSALRFVAEGKKYVVRTTLTIRGLSGWVTYAGTLRGEEPLADELRLAELARDGTALGRDSVAAIP